ncbi:NucA/NucB deoxyribonuclease domain-containing protein [Streptomyces sp. NPDC090106]|uniref:NucA/NucB deoxyribonuclease domain-containing protein n=1 Tax=Streptomyces sp. NPDC090106 TaxID=3365946 RepID=UPI003820E4A1
MSLSRIRRRLRWFATGLLIPLAVGLSGPAAHAQDARTATTASTADAKLIGEPVLLPYKLGKIRPGEKAGRPAPAAQPDRMSALSAKTVANALLNAGKHEQHSYSDTSEVPLTKAATVPSSEATATAAPPTGWGDEPPPDSAACLDRDASETAAGETYNRWLWCKKGRLGIDYYTVNSDGTREFHGTASVAYDAVTVGNGKERAVRTYFQAQYGSVSYDGWNPLDGWIWEVDDLSMYVLSDCTQDASFCYGTGSGIEHTWDEWDYHDEWLHWDIYSDETASTAADKVLYHQWHFRFGGSGGDYVYTTGTTDNHTIRCDSANYFTFFQDYPKACVNYDVIPHLQYSVGDSRVTSVAQHIRFAQNDPTRTYPIEIEPKDIPGKYTGSRDERGLHRVPAGPITSTNRYYKDAACNRTTPYNDQTGLPAYDTATRDCDEYPFQSTDEGAGSPVWDFSVRAVPRAENQAAGGLLIWYYFSDRILHNTDEFWVDITG